MSALYSVWDIVSAPMLALNALLTEACYSVMILSFEKLTPPMPVSLPRSTAALLNAGVLSGPSYPYSS